MFNGICTYFYNLNLFSTMEPEHFVNDYSEMRIEEGVLLVNYKPQMNITIDIAKICVNDRMVFTKGDYFPLVVHMSEIKEISKEAKAFLASDEGMRGITAGAFIVENHLQRLMASVFISLYINMNVGKVPSKLFNNKNAAMVWAKQYRRFRKD